MSPSSAPRTFYGFLELPREIRDAIYEYVVIKKDSVITMLSNAHCHNSQVSAAQPAISYVNKQIRKESLQCFYKKNTFTAELFFPDDLQIAQNWVFALGDEKIGLIRRVLLSNWSYPTSNWSPHQQDRVHLIVNPSEGTFAIEATKGNSCGSESRVIDTKALQNGLTAYLQSFCEVNRSGRAADLAAIMRAFRGYVKVGETGGLQALSPNKLLTEPSNE
jgi:hypothetical protein